MRKAILILLLFFTLSPAARGEEAAPYRTAGDLWTYWCETGTIPDYITGIWSTDGGSENLTFGTLPGEAGEQGRGQILALILNDNTVTFVIQTYSRNYLWAIMEDVNTYFDRGLGFLSAGPYEYENVVQVEIHTDSAENPDTLAAVAELEEKYGSAISISFTDKVYSLTLGTPKDPYAMFLPARKHPSPLPLLWGSCLILLGMIFLMEHRRRLLLNGGGAVLYGRDTLENILREQVPAVPRTLDARIQKTLDDMTNA